MGGLSPRHCRSMEMHNLPIRATPRDHKRDATICACRLSISHAGDGIQASDNDDRIRQDRGGVTVERCTSRPVVQECLL